MLMASAMQSRPVYTSRLDGMTRDAQEMVDLFQGLVTRAMSRRREEHKGMAAIFEKMLQNFTWHVLEEQGEDFRGSKTF